MRAIMVMFDSLRRDLLPGYGSSLLDLPNFARLARRAITFETSYACSLPCMPARRELHTGRANFMHRSWGPIEPFDDSMPELLKQNGIHAHIATDHYHYLEDGGATFFDRYSTWECIRGQEGDKWKGDCTRTTEECSPHLLSAEKMPPWLRKLRGQASLQDDVNRRQASTEATHFQTLTFNSGIEFIDCNAAQDNWFLQLESFDPHEPFFSPENYQLKWFDPDQPFAPDWPPYAPVTESSDVVENVRKKYFALLEFCDRSLGRVLDKMDEYDLWDDTMLIVNTDHGFLLGEHVWWGKGVMPDYEEIVRTPLFIWDPRCQMRNEKRRSLVQTIDLAPTLLEYFNIEIPSNMLGHSLAGILAADQPVRQYAVFGYHGDAMNITDGRYVYMRGVQDATVPANEYTLMPVHMKWLFSPQELEKTELRPPFTFTRKCPVMKIPSTAGAGKVKGSLLFDVWSDPHQSNPLHDPDMEKQMLNALSKLLAENDAPPELYLRYGITIGAS